MNKAVLIEGPNILAGKWAEELRRHGGCVNLPLEGGQQDPQKGHRDEYEPDAEQTVASNFPIACGSRSCWPCHLPLRRPATRYRTATDAAIITMSNTPIAAA